MPKLFKNSFLPYLLFSLFINSFYLQNLKSMNEIEEIDNLEETKNNSESKTAFNKIKETIKNPKVYVSASIIVGILAFLFWKNNPFNTNPNGENKPKGKGTNNGPKWVFAKSGIDGNTAALKVHHLEEMLKAKDESLQLRNEEMQNKLSEINMIRDNIDAIIESNKNSKISEDTKKQNQLRLEQNKQRLEQLNEEVSKLKEDRAKSIKEKKELLSQYSQLTP